MRTAILISALLGLAAAIPRPQDAPDWDAVDVCREDGAMRTIDG